MDGKSLGRLGRTWNPEEGGTHSCEFRPWRQHLLTVTVWVSQSASACLGVPICFGVSVIPIPWGICSLNAITRQGLSVRPGTGQALIRVSSVVVVIQGDEKGGRCALLGAWRQTQADRKRGADNGARRQRSLVAEAQVPIPVLLLTVCVAKLQAT